MEHWIRLARTPGVGPRTFIKLLECFGTAEQVTAAKKSKFLSNGFRSSLYQAIHSVDRRVIESDLQWLEGPERHLLSLTSPHYPALLKEIRDPPPVLLVAGDPCILSQPSIALVGSRNATVIGCEIAQQFAAHLAGFGFVIVSGLAHGIDRFAHLGALSNRQKSTVAVMASGHDRIYPAAHRDLYKRILDVGGTVISEFGTHEPVGVGTFPRRNRIISGLSLGTLVVEASMRSGSLVTAKHALEQNREVFAVPGSIHSTVSKGCNHLIQQGAKLVQQIDDILSELPRPFSGLASEHGRSPLYTDSVQLASLTSPERSVLKALRAQPEPIDPLSQKCGLTPEQVSSILVQLEIKGLVSQVGIGIYTCSVVKELP